MPAQARVGDVVTGECNGPGHQPGYQFTGKWETGSDTAQCDGFPVVRVGDIGTTDCGHTFIAISGSDVTSTDGAPNHRVGDVVEIQEGGSGITITGSDVTLLDE